MSKGLEALERIRLQGFVFDDRHNPQDLDTIEELCDEFVCEHYISANTNDLRKLKPNSIIYGAIWTDKGLIYVAKMNEKGELELL